MKRQTPSHYHLVLQEGLEPPTSRLQIAPTANCDTEASISLNKLFNLVPTKGLFIEYYNSNILCVSSTLNFFNISHTSKFIYVLNMYTILIQVHYHIFMLARY